MTRYNVATPVALRATAEGLALSSPYDPQRCLDIARRFSSKIDTIFIGPEGDHGAAFLRQLSDVSGGTSHTKQIPQLAQAIAGLLGAA